MLDERRMPVARIACDVGFSEPSPLDRAFKRWTGLSPDAWRAQRLGPRAHMSRGIAEAARLREPAMITNDRARG